jgi:hypothetical protein
MPVNLEGALQPRAAVVVFFFCWPWFFGAYLAIQFGAANPSLARTIAGWVFEAPWLAFLAFMAFYLLAKRSAARKLGLAQAAEQERIAAKARADNTARAAEKTDTTTTKVRCLHCQHVQTVPLNESTFVCEQCKAPI